MKLWEISSTETGSDSQSVMRLGNVFQIANGYMGYRGTLDEYGSDQLVGITLAGLFDQVGDAWREPVNAPNPGYASTSVDGVELSALGDKIVQHRQTLRFANARFERESVFEVGGKSVEIRSARFLSAACPNLGVVRYQVTCSKAADLELLMGIDGHIWDLNGPHLPELQQSQEGDVLVTASQTHESRKNVAVAACVQGDREPKSHEIKDRRNLRAFSVRAKPGVTYTFDTFFAVVTDNDPLSGLPAMEAKRIVESARADGYEACLETHDAIWGGQWAESDVVLEGDDEAQLALRYSVLQLLMVAPVKGSGNSIPARALSGQVYKGAIFWDTELFMYPFFLHTNPEVAKELLRYRILTLDGARRKAASEGPGFRGAFYAWESQETGDDACSYFNVGDPVTGRALRTHFRDKQVHISGDIAIAMWKYFLHTGDDSLLLEGGAEVILECARFYFSYAYFKKDKDRYEILDVIGPDEYHERVNNNAFTSRVAKETFEIALAAVDFLKREYPETLDGLLDRLEMKSEISGFEDAAAKLYVPQADRETGVIEQFDGYLKLRDTAIETLKQNLVHPNEYLGAGQGLAVPTQVIKQADVVMMLNVFKDRYDAKVKEANWNYYEPRTEHGSSLSACAYALVALEFGELDFAYRYFLKTAKIDLEAKYKLYAGTVFIGGSHPAANGGAWMTAVFGFGGVHANEERLSIQPRLYPKWTRLQFPLSYLGDRFVVTITSENVTVTSSPQNQKVHEVLVGGDIVSCAPARKVVVETKQEDLVGYCK